jgi:hypothetical protein
VMLNFICFVHAAGTSIQTEHCNRLCFSRNRELITLAYCPLRMARNRSSGDLEYSYDLSFFHNISGHFSSQYIGILK